MSHFILRYNACLLHVIPDHPDARQFLTGHRRQLESSFVKGRRVSRSVEDVELYYKADVNDAGIACLYTYAGFHESLAKHLREKGHTVIIQDVHEHKLPLPNLAAAVRGLYEPQARWVVQGLMQQKSGLFGAPTRYGKTFAISAVCSAFPGQKTVVTAPGKDLCRQLYIHLRDALPHRDVRAVYSGAPKAKGRRMTKAEKAEAKKSAARVQGPDITVCSLDSLHKMDEDTDLLLLDEPHAIITDRRIERINKFTKARRYGFGATLEGRYDKRDSLIEGLIGPIISHVSYREAVAQKVIAPLKLVFIKVPFSHASVPGKWLERDDVYKLLLRQSPRTADLIRRISCDIIPAHWQTMSFIADEAQAEFYLEHAMPKDGTIAMAKRMKDSEREALTDRIVSNQVKRVIASNIYVQGLTFPDLKVVINLNGGGANTIAIQKPGRLLQRRPDKRFGVMIDLMFECVDADSDNRKDPPYKCIINEAWARHKAYAGIGYDIEFVDDGARLGAILREAYTPEAFIAPPAPITAQQPAEHVQTTEEEE